MIVVCLFKLAIGMSACTRLFFFSSRRRHTRLQGDWSSDVCSSDLDRRRHELGLPTEQVQSEAVQRVDVLVAVDVPHLRTERSLDDDGINELFRDRDRKSVV